MMKPMNPDSRYYMEKRTKSRSKSNKNPSRSGSKGSSRKKTSMFHSSIWSNNPPKNNSMNLVSKSIREMSRDSHDALDMGAAAPHQ
jgi:hypothetical protein